MSPVAAVYIDITSEVPKGIMRPVALEGLKNKELLEYKRQQYSCLAPLTGLTIYILFQK